MNVSGYLRSFELKVPFGEGVETFTVKHLETGDIIELVSGDPPLREMVMRFGKMLGKYVEGHTVKDAAGTTVPLDEITRVAYFTPLLVDLMAAMMEAAQVKNTSPSDKTSTVSLSEGLPRNEVQSQG